MWPSNGHLKFEDVHLRYRNNTELVLKGLSFEIEAGMKVGVVGRTGAGKSTISLAISRIVELEKGSIKIDGTDIADLPLDMVRKNITIIPQDPTLFTGTLRFNIDPNGAQTDEAMLSFLEQAGL